MDCSSTSEKPLCQFSGYKISRKKVYKILDVNNGYDDAETQCESIRGGSLVTFKNEAEFHDMLAIMCECRSYKGFLGCQKIINYLLLQLYK